MTRRLFDAWCQPRRQAFRCTDASTKVRAEPAAKLGAYCDQCWGHYCEHGSPEMLAEGRTQDYEEWDLLSPGDTFRRWNRLPGHKTPKGFWEWRVTVVDEHGLWGRLTHWPTRPRAMDAVRRKVDRLFANGAR